MDCAFRLCWFPLNSRRGNHTPLLAGTFRPAQPGSRPREEPGKSRSRSYSILSYPPSLCYPAGGTRNPRAVVLAATAGSEIQSDTESGLSREVPMAGSAAAPRRTGALRPSFHRFLHLFRRPESGGGMLKLWRRLLRLGSFGCSRRGGGLAGAIESPETPAVLAFPAPVRIAGGALFSLLQGKPAGAVTYMAQTRSFAMRTSSPFFSHQIDSPFPGPGKRDSSSCFGFPAAGGGSENGSGGISLLLS